MNSRRAGSVLRGALLAGALALAGSLAAADPAGAQSVGFEAGLAGIENYDPVTPSLGVTLFLPLTDRLRAAASYSQWTGCDGNAGCEDPRTGYGNRAVNVLGLFRLVDVGPALSVGAGAGWYEMLRLRDGRSDSYLQGAMTFSSEARFPVAYNSSTYLRGDLSIPTNDSAPRWGFLRLGVDVGIF
jgi:hypothetical protein